MGKIKGVAEAPHGESRLAAGASRRRDERARHAPVPRRVDEEEPEQHVGPHGARAAAVGARGTCAAEQTRENTEQRGEAALLKIKIKGVAEGRRRRYTPRHVVVW